MLGLIGALGPMLMLMLVPVAIPVIAVGIGALIDRLRPPQHSDAEEAVKAAVVRTAAWRAELQRQDALRTEDH